MVLDGIGSSSGNFVDSAASRGSGENNVEDASVDHNSGKGTQAPLDNTEVLNEKHSTHPPNKQEDSVVADMTEKPTTMVCTKEICMISALPEEPPFMMRRGGRVGTTAKVIDPVPMKRSFKCACCGLPRAPLVCTKCYSVQYCGKECHIRHSKYHKVFCKVLTVKQRQIEYSILSRNSKHLAIQIVSLSIIHKTSQSRTRLSLTAKAPQKHETAE